MNLYEIDSAIESLLEVDPDTGEVTFDEAALAQLKMEKDRITDNTACLVKNLLAEAAAIKTEEDNLAKRRKTLEKKAQRLKDYLQDALAGQKFSSARAAITFRRSEKVEVDDGLFLSTSANAYLVKFEPKYSKTEIKTEIKAGREIPGAKLVDSLSMTIK